MNRSATFTKILQALFAARKEFPKVKPDKTANGTKFSYRYASLPHVLDECEPKLWAHGILVLQPLCRAEKPNHIAVETVFSHVESGEWLSEIFELALDSGGAQGSGITASYARRYAFNSFLTVAPDDDTDGVGASKQGRVKKESHSPAMIAWVALPDEKREELMKHVGPMVDYLNDGMPLEAIGYLERKVPDQEDQVALWSQFGSEQRRAMKEADAARKIKRPGNGRLS